MVSGTYPFANDPSVNSFTNSLNMSACTVRNIQNLKQNIPTNSLSFIFNSKTPSSFILMSSSPMFLNYFDKILV